MANEGLRRLNVPAMDIEDVEDKYRERLAEKGLSLEIWQDDSYGQYLEYTDEPVVVMMRPGSDYAPLGPEEKYLDWDLRRPFDERNGGFSKYSLFLYINTEDAIRKWMAQGFEDYTGRERWEPDCKDALSALSEIGKAIADPKTRADHVLEALEIIGIDDLLDGADEASARSDADYALYDMLGPSLLNGATIDGVLDGTPLSETKKGVTRAAESIGELAVAYIKGAPLLPVLEKTQKDLSAWVDAYKETFGGELLYVRAVKKEMATRFGATEPKAVEGIDLGHISGARREDPESSDMVILMHAKDAEDVGPGFFNDVVQSVIACVNGEVFGFSLTNAKGEVVSSCGGFVGRDMAKNGLDACLLAETDALCGAQAPSA